MIYEVILDLDDVLNTFCMTALSKLTGCDPDYHLYPADCGWDIVSAANVLSPYQYPSPFTSKSFWEALDQEFWATIPPTTFLGPLIRYLKDRVGKDNIIIATSPTLSPACVAGKLEWIHTYLPKWLHRQYMIGPCKDKLANPHALLIDDRRGNCDKFINRGGQALMVYKPWNYTPICSVYKGEPVHQDWDAYTEGSLSTGLYSYFGKRFEP